MQRPCKTEEYTVPILPMKPHAKGKKLPEFHTFLGVNSMEYNEIYFKVDRHNITLSDHWYWVNCLEYLCRVQAFFFSFVHGGFKFRICSVPSLSSQSVSTQNIKKSTPGFSSSFQISLKPFGSLEACFSF